MTVDLKTRAVGHYAANDLGTPALAKSIGQKVRKPRVSSGAKGKKKRK